MTRTNIDIDDELIARAMARYKLRSKKEAVDYALRRLVGVPLTKERLLGLRGTGYETDIEALRAPHDPWASE